ncbi:MAG TPA: DUF4389 domain-containing protein [Gammaproteobacteria bacterium]|nr:DUF4389 domain-containing protein [Gammaproteobacteria bacterium]
MSTELRENLKRGSTWIRGLYMLLFVLIFNLVELVLWAMAGIQFLFHLFTGTPNERLRDFGGRLGTYLREITAFLTYSSEDKPFPFAPWPEAGEPEPRGRAGGEVPPAEDAADPGERGQDDSDGGDTDDNDPNEAGVR